MKWLLQRSLVRRVALSLMFAFTLAWIVLVAYVYLDFRMSMYTDSNVVRAGRELNAVLADVENPSVAAEVVRTMDAMVNRMRHEWGRTPEGAVFQLKDAQGRLLYASPAIIGLALPGEPGRMIDVALHDRRYWLYEGRSARWRVWVGEPHRGTPWVIGLFGSLLVMPFLIAFPFVLAPVWIAARQGLKPLRLLGERIQTRSADDLTPLKFAPKYAELKPLVMALEDLLAQLRGKVERERSFVNDAAHELRTPLAVIGVQAHVLSRSTDPAEREEAAQHLAHAIARSSHLIRQLLELATMEGSSNPEVQCVDIAELTRRHLAQTARDAAERQLELTFESPDRVCFTLSVPLYESVLRNLLDNATKYVDEGGQVSVALRAEDGVLVLSVIDTGPGIPLEEHALVFDRFHRVSGTSAQGSGLGLSIARQACQRMGGMIELTPNPAGLGCAFTVRIRSRLAPDAVSP
ncbi:sensor histidine kinase [Acidovorax cavernicola]|uniref:histidine kinase n=1 Tax=Acidovorax cavernicola TaxID=1675792 RepID=A0A9X8D9H3_9BURK|nr:ATP-binding protein [Acidovorax cavernicola]RIX84708.1 sensor histidine kinase [Acidovorax cavernicola]